MQDDSERSTAGSQFELTISPDFVEVRRALAEIKAYLKPLVADDPIDTFEIIGAEVLNNVVEHGFAGLHDADCRIDICTCVEARRLTLLVADNGKPMPGGQTPGPTERQIDPTNLDGLPEGGFGWNLIHMLSNELAYAREDGTNRLHVAIDL